MFKKLALLAVAVVFGLGVAVTASAGTDPWEDDSACGHEAMYNGQGTSAWQADLCNQFELDQALLYNAVITDWFEQYTSIPLGANLYPSPFPCATNGNGGTIAPPHTKNGLQVNFYNTTGGFDVGSPNEKNTWYGFDGVICEQGSPERIASDPLNRIEAMEALYDDGQTFEEVFNDYVEDGKANDRVWQHLVDATDGSADCNPTATVFNGKVVRPAQTCVVVTEHSTTYDPEFVAKRFPSYLGN